MPMITVRTVTPTPRPDLPARIASLVTRLGADILKKDPKVTAVLVEQADPANWFIAGEQPALAGLSAFWIDIKVTAGTNTKAETTAFVAAAFAEMAALLGPVHPESYVLVHAADGDAYGYGGKTQNERWMAARAG